jgi:hypothetical protein
MTLILIGKRNAQKKLRASHGRFLHDRQWRAGTNGKVFVTYTLVLFLYCKELDF